MKNNYSSLSLLARKILFEDSYPRFTTQSFRAGTQFVEDEPRASGEPEEANPDIGLPVEISPQAATQLSTDEPPVDDPDFEPMNAKELASALYVLAQRLPDKLVGGVYKKFEEYVDRHSRDELNVSNEEQEEQEIEMSQSEEMAERLSRLSKVLKGL